MTHSSLPWRGGRRYVFLPPPATLLATFFPAMYMLALMFTRVAGPSQWLAVAAVLLASVTAMAISMLGSATLHVGVDGVAIRPAGLFSRLEFYSLHTVSGAVSLTMAGRPALALMLKAGTGTAIGPWMATAFKDALMRRQAAACEHISSFVEQAQIGTPVDDPWIETLRPGLDASQRIDALRRAPSMSGPDAKEYRRLLRACVASPHLRRQMLREMRRPTSNGESRTN